MFVENIYKYLIAMRQNFYTFDTNVISQYRKLNINAEITDSRKNFNGRGWKI